MYCFKILGIEFDILCPVKIQLYLYWPLMRYCKVTIVLFCEFIYWCVMPPKFLGDVIYWNGHVKHQSFESDVVSSRSHQIKFLLPRDCHILI